MTRATLALLAALLALGLGALRAGAGRATELPAARALPRPASAAQRASAPELALAPEPTLAPVPAARRQALDEPRPETALATLAKERAPRAVRELAALLVSEPFDRAAFERAAEALARGLAPEEPETLAAGLAQGDLPLAQRLAACELLRVLAPRAGTLPGALGAELRVLALRGSSGALPESAARVLVALGTTADAQVLIEALGHEEPLVRARSARALAGAATLPEPARSALVLELELALAGASDPGVTAGLERALAALRPRRAEPEELARVLLAPATDARERLLAAAELARTPQVLAPEAHAAARELLVARAEGGEPAERRRALHALGTLADPATLATLTQGARFDPDPTARSAGVRALRAFEARATLEAIATSDPSPEVRALAAQELAQAERR